MASGVIATVGAFTEITAGAWAADTNPQYIKMLGVRNAINDIRGLYEAVVIPANVAVGAKNDAQIQAVTDAFTLFQASQVKLVNLLTGVYPGGSRKKRQSKKRKNHRNHSNNKQ